VAALAAVAADGEVRVVMEEVAEVVEMEVVVVRQVQQLLQLQLPMLMLEPHLDLQHLQLHSNFIFPLTF
jgi:hypothetical protein